MAPTRGSVLSTEGSQVNVSLQVVAGPVGSTPPNTVSFHLLCQVVPIALRALMVFSRPGTASEKGNCSTHCSLDAGTTSAGGLDLSRSPGPRT